MYVAIGVGMKGPTFKLSKSLRNTPHHLQEMYTMKGCIQKSPERAIGECPIRQLGNTDFITG